jgi:integrase
MAKIGSKLTKTMIDDLSEGQSAYGSNLRATRNKTCVTFHASFAVDGKRYLERMGSSPTLNLTEAIKAAAHYRTNKERELHLAKSGDAESDMSLLEAVPMYLSYLEHNAGKNMKMKTTHFRRYIIPALGEKKIRQIYASDIEAFRIGILNKGISKATVNRVMASLSHFYTHALMNRWVHRKPYQTANYKEEFKARNKVAPEHQTALLDAAQRSDQHPMIYLFLLIGFGVGMRHSEILNICWENIDWKTGYIWLPNTKTGPREQPTTKVILDELAALNQQRGEHTGFVFSSTKSASGRIDRMNKPFRRVCKAAGVPDDYTPHFMRHTCVSELVAEGYNNHLVGHFTGHKTPAMIARYTHLKGAKIVDDVMQTRGQNFIKAV